MKTKYSTSPLTVSYWQGAWNELKDPRRLAFAALMIAACTALALIPSIPTTDPNVRVTWGFLARAVCGMVCGPVVALVFGAAEDTINYLIAPSGPYFPGYTLTTMIGTFLYALFLYRMKRPTPSRLLVRVFLAKTATNILNVVLGALWSAILYSKGYLYYMVLSFWKNLVMLPVQTVMLYLLLLALVPILRRMGLIGVPARPRQPEAALAEETAEPPAPVPAVAEAAEPAPVPIPEPERIPVREPRPADISLPPPTPAAPTVIAAGAAFFGDLRVTGDLEVLGKVKGNVEAAGSVRVTGAVQGDIKGASVCLERSRVRGNVTSASLVSLDAGAAVVGDVKAQELRCAGKVKGDVRVSGAALLSGEAVLAGSVTASTVAISQGVRLQGTVRIVEDPAANALFGGVEI